MRAGQRHRGASCSGGAPGYADASLGTTRRLTRPPAAHREHRANAPKTASLQCGQASATAAHPVAGGAPGYADASLGTIETAHTRACRSPRHRANASETAPLQCEQTHKLHRGAFCSEGARAKQKVELHPSTGPCCVLEPTRWRYHNGKHSHCNKQSGQVDDINATVSTHTSQRGFITQGKSAFIRHPIQAVVAATKPFTVNPYAFMTCQMEWGVAAKRLLPCSAPHEPAPSCGGYSKIISRRRRRADYPFCRALIGHNEIMMQKKRGRNSSWIVHG